MKNRIALCPDRSGTALVRIKSEVLENCHFYDFAIFSNCSRRPSWLAQPKKRKGLNLQIILIETDLNLFSVYWTIGVLTKLDS